MARNVETPDALCRQNHRFIGARAMAQDACVTPRELFDELLPSTPAAYSATDVIGEKLRALYDDTAQPCPARMMQLLRSLDAQKSDCVLTQIPHLGTIN
jgi:Anti-sigma factor NepR